MSAARFYARYSWFGMREQLSDWASGLVSYLLFPFFLFVLTAMWKRFNSALGHYTANELSAYVGVTEILFMTFLRSTYFTRASGDFSLSMARPRSWLAMSGAQCFGRVLGNRLVMTGILVPCLFLFGNSPAAAGGIVGRLFVVLLPLCVLAALYNLAFASAQVLWAQTIYLSLPFTKIFLVFGGVFGPLNDYSDAARPILIALPSSDLFFQPAYYCVKGAFYEMTPQTWACRVALQAAVLLVFNLWFYRFAKRHHQAYGG